MRVALKQIKTYVRFALVLVVVIAILLVLWNNRSYTVKFWFFGITDISKPVNVVWLLLSTALATRTVMWLTSFAISLWRDFRELKQMQNDENEKKERQRRESELEEREQRLDEKLKQVLDENENEQTGETP